MSFRADLETLKDTFVEAIADKKLCVHEYLQLIAESCKVLEGIVSGIGGDDVQFNQLVADVEGIVQDHIVPLDLTKYRVPAIVERFVIDPQLVPSVRPLLELMRPAPHSEETT